MKAAVVLFVIVGSALAAPTEEADHNIESQQMRAPYGSSCGGGAPIAPVALYLSPQSPYGSIAHYREDEHKEDKAEHARSYYDSPAGGIVPTAAGAGLPLASAAASGPAVGLFPNAKVGGCAVPLLLSCAPNVVSGHLAASSHSVYPAAYRTEDAEKHKLRESENDKPWSSERNGHQQNLELQETQDTHHLLHNMMPIGHQAFNHHQISHHHPHGLVSFPHGHHHHGHIGSF